MAIRLNSKDSLSIHQIQHPFGRDDYNREPLLNGPVDVFLSNTRAKVSRFFIEHVLPAQHRNNPNLIIRNGLFNVPAGHVGREGLWHGDPYPVSSWLSPVGLYVFSKDNVPTDVLHPFEIPDDCRDQNGKITLPDQDFFEKLPYDSFLPGTLIFGSTVFVHRRAQLIQPGVRLVYDWGFTPSIQRGFTRDWDEWSRYGSSFE